MNKPTLPDGWVDLKGKAYPTWPVVLHAAHQKGLTGIETELLQIPDKENGNVAIVRCTATFVPVEGAPCAFSALGDASPANVGAFLVPALIRMAETRAKGRALRDACDIGQTLAEEIGPESASDQRSPDSEDASQMRHEPRTAPPRARHDPEDHATAELGRTACQLPGCGVLLTADEIKGCHKNFGEERWCSLHGKARLKELRDQEQAIKQAEAEA